ncbi:hypothetical protein [Desertimonas flava]|uniref:hypothetical protein n=1 Tax=Desertimonas flava TaxID=2064846 RepID=UPI000E3494BC|nr:hypothetical protein [Desertimonas flava]
MITRSRFTIAIAATASALAVTPLLVGASPAADAPAKTPVPTTAPVGTPTAPPPGPTVPAAPTTAPAQATTVPVGSPTTAPAVPTEAPGPTPVHPTVVGPNGITVTDNTGTLNITVPTDWVDVDARSGIRDDGSQRPTVSASPDLDAWTSTWTVPGTYATVLGPNADPATLLSAYTFTNACTEGAVEQYNDGRLVGLRQVWSNCDGTNTQLVNIAARSADNLYTVFAQVQLLAPDAALLGQILGSVGAVPGTNPGQSPAPPPTPATLGVAPPALLQGVVPPDSRTVTDQTGRVSVAAPSAWTDVVDAPRLNDDFSERPFVAVAPDVDAYFTDWEAPGLEVTAYPFRPDPYTIIANQGWPDDCDDGGLYSVSIRGLTGLMQMWLNCGGTASRIISVAVSPASQSTTAYLEIQLPTSDDATLSAALASLTVN